MATPCCGNGSMKGGNVKESNLNKGGDMSWRGGRGSSPTKTIKVSKGSKENC